MHISVINGKELSIMVHKPYMDYWRKYKRKGKKNKEIKDKIGKVWSLEHSDIPELFFMPHFVGQCYTDVASRMTEAQGCPGLVAKVGGGGRGGSWGKAPAATITGCEPQQSKHPRKGPGQ
jgi:hypothetical protein